jgi:hypothetical protein
MDILDHGSITLPFDQIGTEVQRMLNEESRLTSIVVREVYEDENK